MKRIRTGISEPPDLPTAARYCDHCGTQLSIASRPVRKVVSVVFGDLVGSTALQENLDPERAALVMGRYYELMRATVSEHGGRLEKFVGDGVVAVFGADRLGEDDALRATRCAAGMSAALRVMSLEAQQVWDVRLRMRIGVHTGELVVGGGQELVGDTMNTAARLEQAAAPDEILIGEATRRLVRDKVVLEPIPPLTLRGKAVPLRAWRLVSTEPERGQDDVLDARLIGRTAALDRLLTALDTVATTGQPHLVTVIGAPGMGKSRLLREFVDTVAARDRDEHIAVVHARCEPGDPGCRSIPELLRRAARAGTDRLLPRWDLAHPVVLVMDDVHQADPALRRLVTDLVRRPTAPPVLVVAAARPQLRNLDERMVATTPAADGAQVMIELVALTPPQSRRMVREMLGCAVLPSAFIQRMVTTSEGNPLFLTELVRMLADEQVLVRSEGRWEYRDGVGLLSVPPTVHQIVGARLERLDPDERFTLECAAVIGRVFTTAGVRALVGPHRAGALEAELHNLRVRELIAPLDPSGEAQHHRFLSEVVRDVAYALLLKQTRAELHEAYGRWLLGGSGDHRAAARWHSQRALSYRRQLGG